MGHLTYVWQTFWPPYWIFTLMVLCYDIGNIFIQFLDPQNIPLDTKIILISHILLEIRAITHIGQIFDLLLHKILVYHAFL